MLLFPMISYHVSYIVVYYIRSYHVILYHFEITTCDAREVGRVATALSSIIVHPNLQTYDVLRISYEP